MINKLVDESYQIAQEHGFWDDPYLIQEVDIRDGDTSFSLGFAGNPLAIPTKLWLAAGELVEAGNIHHKYGLDDPANLEKFIEELADVFIRLFDLVGYVSSQHNGQVDLEAAILRKTEVNRGRPHRHGKNY